EGGDRGSREHGRHRGGDEEERLERGDRPRDGWRRGRAQGAFEVLHHRHRGRETPAVPSTGVTTAEGAREPAIDGPREGGGQLARRHETCRRGGFATGERAPPGERPIGDGGDRPAVVLDSFLDVAPVSGSGVALVSPRGSQRPEIEELYASLGAGDEEEPARVDQIGRAHV